MDDEQTAIAGVSEPIIAETGDADTLIQFVPGEDMIAAHKRAMRARDAEGDWRGNEKTPLPSFFSGDMIESSSALPPGLPFPPAKPKVFNAADYLRPSKPQNDDDHYENEADTVANAFQSRFSKFFQGAASSPSGAAVASSEPSASSSRSLPSQEAMPRSPLEPFPLSRKPPNPPAAMRADDHMAKLMGMLSAVSSRPPGLVPILIVFRAQIPRFLAPMSILDFLLKITRSKQESSKLLCSPRFKSHLSHRSIFRTRLSVHRG